jgi:hypothetical protein
MDLSYSPEYEAFRDQVRGFLDTHRHLAPPSGGPRDERARAWQRLLIEHGYTARTIPREYGGGGHAPDILKARIIAEEFAAARVSPGLGGQGISMLVPTLLEVGTEEQKRRFIPPTLSGEMIWCQGYSEPGAGSDLASLRTSAVLDGDHWVVDQHRPPCPLDLLPGAHRAAGPQAPRHQLPAVSHGHPGHRDPPAGRHDDEPQLQRGLLHRRARAEGPDRRPAR